MPNDGVDVNMILPEAVCDKFHKLFEYIILLYMDTYINESQQSLTIHCLLLSNNGGTLCVCVYVILFEQYSFIQFLICITTR